MCHQRADNSFLYKKALLATLRRRALTPSKMVLREVIDKNMKKMDLVENENIGISSSTLAKMSRGETVSMSILEKICMELDCDFGDIISIDKNNKIGK